ncbi:hypothetical protein [Yinghuangia sp. YIM S09857]|uniref:hypothetical protein n=1 Tax=Yinghuangia sp. YIM S09857 TaxID=3436929 RepID=UPI003F52A542
MDSSSWGMAVLATGFVAILVNSGVLRLRAKALIRRVPEIEQRAMAADMTVYQAAGWPRGNYGGSRVVNAGARVLISQGLLHISRYGVVTPAAGADDNDADAVGKAILRHVRQAQQQGNARLYDCHASIPPPTEAEQALETQRALRALEERGARVARVVSAVAAIAAALLIAADSVDSITKGLTALAVSVFAVGLAVTVARDLAKSVIGKHRVQTPNLDTHCRALVDATLNPLDDEDVRAAVTLSCTRPKPVALIHPKRPKAPDRDDSSDGCGDGCDGCGCGE